MVKMGSRCSEVIPEGSNCDVPYVTYNAGVELQESTEKTSYTDQNVTYFLVSNNPDGQVMHQIIQVPQDSVLLVGDVQSCAEDVTYLPIQDISREDDGTQLADIHDLPGDSRPIETYDEPISPPPSSSLTDDVINSSSSILPDDDTNTPSILLSEEHSTDLYTKTCCTVCREFFETTAQLREHNLVKHKDLFTCGICLRGFSTVKYLKTHVETHQPKQFKCVQCNAMFSRAASLILHFKRVHRQKELCLKCGRIKSADHECYKCDDCSSSFRTLASLEKHECEKNRVFVCPYCGESFTRHQGLLNHMLNKENKRKFTCVVCTRSFNTQAQLRRHERIHAPESWFKCAKCGSKYATASGFRSHNIKKHSGHDPNSLPPKGRLDLQPLRKHRQYRDGSVQTKVDPSRRSSPQTQLPVQSSDIVHASSQTQLLVHSSDSVHSSSQTQLPVHSSDSVHSSSQTQLPVHSSDSVHSSSQTQLLVHSSDSASSSSQSKLPVDSSDSAHSSEASFHSARDTQRDITNNSQASFSNDMTHDSSFVQCNGIKHAFKRTSQDLRKYRSARMSASQLFSFNPKRKSLIAQKSFDSRGSNELERSSSQKKPSKKNASERKFGSKRAEVESIKKEVRIVKESGILIGGLEEGRIGLSEVEDDSDISQEYNVTNLLKCSEDIIMSKSDFN